MNSRLEIFRRLVATHPACKQMATSLEPEEYEKLIEFLMEHSELSSVAYHLAVDLNFGASLHSSSIRILLHSTDYVKQGRK